MITIDKRALGLEIEEMEFSVEEQDRSKFLEIIEKYTKDMHKELTIAECVERLDTQECINLHSELLELHYEED